MLNIYILIKKNKMMLSSCQFIFKLNEQRYGGRTYVYNGYRNEAHSILFFIFKIIQRR